MPAEAKKQLFYEDVEIGQEITPLVKGPMTTLHIMRWSAAIENWHRIHYDRDYVTKVEKLPGLVVQSSLISQLMLEMCRKELPARQVKSFEFKSFRQIYDTGKFTLAGYPGADGREATLWALDAEGRLAMMVSAKLA
jgi:3-methylfumaryl-CoA hydratase